MRNPRTYTTCTALLRRLPVLLVLTLLIGCDSTPTSLPTPISAPASITPTTGTGAVTPAPTTVTKVSPTNSPSSATASPVSTDGGSPTSPAAWAQTLPWRGGDWYLFGVNYPYYHYGNDFGGNKWGSYGVHDPKSYATVDADFADMSSHGLRTVRWFVFADGRAGIKFDAEGLPTGLDEFVFQDFDAALEIAQRHNIALDLVLLDFRFVWDAKMENDVQMAGHSIVLQTPAGQQALVQNVFEPLFRRYANHPAILSWEVMNEPEWILQDAGTVDHANVSQPLSLATFRAFARMTVDAIHTIGQSYATIGCADMKWAQNMMGLDLDYYQIHYYDWMQPWSTDNLFAVRAESLRLDRPVVVGEFPADHSTVAGLRDYFNTWYVNGYAGAWPWSYRGDTTWGSPDTEVLSIWADAHREMIDIPATP